MSEHLDTHVLGRFIARELPPDELLRAARHIGVCRSCRERIARAHGTGARIESLRAELLREDTSVEQHLDYELLEAYVDDTLDAVGRDIARNHLAVCPHCADEAQELATLKEDLAHSRHASNAAASLPSERTWQRLRDSLRMSPRIGWAAAALLTVAVAVGLLLWQRGKSPKAANENSGNAPEVVNDDSGNAPGDINNNRKLPEVVKDDGVNDNANGPVVGSTPRDPYDAVIKRALETQRIDHAPVLKELAGRPSTLMGREPGVDLAHGPQGATFAPLRPVGTATSSGRPTFHWQPLAGATSYKVHVLDTDFNVVAESGPVTATSWSPPNALKRGVVYLWQVSAAKDGAVISAPAAPAPEARFKILTTTKARDVQRAVRRAGSHLARGIIYAHAGLLDDAERELRTALSRTQEAATARKLLQDLSTARRR